MRTGLPFVQIDKIPDLRMFKSNVFVVDHDRSLRFYVDQLGFNVVADARFGPDLRWVAVAPPNGSAVLALVAPKPDSEDYALIGRATQISFITEDINATFQQWHKRGVRSIIRHKLRVGAGPPPTSRTWMETPSSFLLPTT